MVAPFIQDPLEGLLGSRTATFFLLDRFSGLPVAALGFTQNPFVPNPAAVTADVVDSESYSISVDVTQNALQDFSNASTNAHLNLDTMTVSGTWVSSIDLGPLGSIGLPNLPTFGLQLLRTDLTNKQFLEAMIRRREPVMVVTPRRSMPKAFMTELSEEWDPSTGENTLLTISLMEARIVSPLPGSELVPDVGTLAAGSVVGSNAGSQAAQPVSTPPAAPPPAPGAAPLLGPI